MRAVGPGATYISARSPTAIMLSFKSALSPVSSAAAAAVLTRKRKRGVVDDDGRGGIELSLEAAPLPLEWQRCLDIKSGQIHYYNTRTHKRTWTRPRGDHQHQHRGLDLELNLAFDPQRAGAGEDQRPAGEEAEAATLPVPDAAMEMVAAVCMRCHMLVMMCCACPACPNCKFLHPMGASHLGAVARASPPAAAAAPAKLARRIQ